MFWDDIALVTEQVEKYGLRKPFVDLGGMIRPCIADYTLTRDSGEQNDRFVYLGQRPFDHIDPSYELLNPDKGAPLIEDLPYTCRESFGTAVCLNVLEHVENPFRVFAALYQLMKPDSLLIVSTVFSFPHHPSPNDFWRFSPECLRHLATNSGFTVLEGDWRLDVPAEWGIRDLQTGRLQQIKSVYVTLAKSGFVPKPCGPFPLPQRLHRDGVLC
jgi:hypothetical protein